MPAKVENWPSRGGGLASTRATTSETVIGPANVSRLTQAWTTPNLKGMSATPLYLDGVLYFGDWTGSVRALDATTGRSVWTTDLKQYYIGGSLAADADRLYVGRFDAKITALDRRTGAEVWTTAIDDGPGSAVFASPVVVDGLVITGVASFQEFGDPSGARFRGHVVGLDATSGQERWRFWTTNNDATSGPGIAVWSAVSVDAERHLAYVPTGNNYRPPSGPNSDAVVAIDTRTGEVKWVTRFTEGDVWTLKEGEGPDADVGAPPNLFEIGGRPALAVGDKGGTMHALDRVTGEALWKTKLTEGGKLGGVMAAAAVQGGQIFVTSNRASQAADLVALSTDDGQQRWRVDVGGHVTGPVTWSNGVVFVGDDTGRFSGFDASNGSKLWSVTVPGQAAGGVLVAEGMVFAGFGWWLAGKPADPQGGLIAYRLGSGSGSGGDSDGGGGTASSGTMSGARLYERSCASCHGGDGAGGFGPTLLGVAQRYSRDQHLEIVRKGKKKMPAWESVLTPEEVEAVVTYERETFK